MLRQNLLYAQSRGLDRVLITCDADNLASERTILANGGVYETTVPVDGSLTKRYWVRIFADQ